MANETKLVAYMRAEFEKKALVLRKIHPSYPAKEICSRFSKYLDSVEACDGVFWATLRDSVSVSHALQHLNSFNQDANAPVEAMLSTGSHVLFIGNLGTTYTDAELRDLFKPHGAIVRAFVVRNERTAASKGYGFVELLTPKAATEAKSALASKQLNGRAIRVDWIESPMESISDIHSRTLFIDRLPRNFGGGLALRNACEIEGAYLEFCQVAYSSGRSSSGKCRGFALADFATSKGAEIAQEYLNDLELTPDVRLRAAFGNPGKLGQNIFSKQHSGQSRIRQNSGTSEEGAQGNCSGQSQENYEQQQVLIHSTVNGFSSGTNPLNYHHEGPRTRFQHRQQQMHLHQLIQPQHQNQCTTQGFYQQYQSALHFQQMRFYNGGHGAHPMHLNSVVGAPTLVAPTIHSNGRHQMNLSNRAVENTQSQPTLPLKQQAPTVQPHTTNAESGFIGRPRVKAMRTYQTRSALKSVSSRNEDNLVIPTLLTSPKSMFSASIETRSRKRRVQPDFVFVETKRQYSNQHDQGIDFISSLSEVSSKENFSVSPHMKRRRSNRNLAIPTLVSS